jgi:hypothetical protein
MANAAPAEPNTDKDPLHSISEAMRDAIRNASEDAAKAHERIRETRAGVSQSVSRFGYTSSYMISYGIVYGTVFIARALPQDNPVMEGFIDGGRAAIEALNEAKAGPIETDNLKA